MFRSICVWLVVFVCHDGTILRRGRVGSGNDIGARRMRCACIRRQTHQGTHCRLVALLLCLDSNKLTIGGSNIPAQQAMISDLRALCAPNAQLGATATSSATAAAAAQCVAEVSCRNARCSRENHRLPCLSIDTRIRSRRRTRRPPSSLSSNRCSGTDDALIDSIIVCCCCGVVLINELDASELNKKEIGDARRVMDLLTLG